MLRTQDPPVTPRVHLAVLALTTMFLLGCGTTGSEAPGASSDALAKEQVEAAAGRIWTAVSQSDAEGILAEYGDDAILLGPGAPLVQGKPAITTYLRELMGAVAFQDVDGRILDVTVSGDLAIETGTYAWTIVAEGGPPMPDAGKYVHVWKRSPEGAWRVMRYIINSDTP